MGDPLLAVEFLTIARFRRFRTVSAEALARSQAFYPLVGLALGGLLLLLDWLLRGTFGDATLAAVLVTALAIVTRGLHLDGLADTFDGLLGGEDRERRLAIMRDPRLGSFGVLALTLVLLLKWSAIVELTGGARPLALLMAPVLARFAMVVTAATLPYAREHGLGAGYREAARGLTLAVAAALTLLIALVAAGIAGLAFVALAASVALCIGAWAQRLLGGVTGDVYGAVCELTEMAVLLAAAGAAAHSWLGPWPGLW